MFRKKSMFGSLRGNLAQHGLKGEFPLTIYVKWSNYAKENMSP